MNRASTAGCALAALTLFGLAGAPSAQADPADDAVAALRTNAIYVGASTPTIDRSKLGAEQLGGIKVAVLPTGGPDPLTVARSIGSRLDADHSGTTVLVFEGRSYGAASTARCGVGSAIKQAVARNRASLQSTDDVTGTVTDFAAAVSRLPSADNGCADAGSSSSGDQAAKDNGSSHTGLIVLLVIVAAVVGGLGYFAYSRRRRQRRELSDARAQVMPYYDRLASEVNTLDPGDDPTARQAVADAAERFGSAGGQLAAADSVEKYAQARRTTLEGLYAARTARKALGRDPGPDLPPVAESTGDHLDRPREVTVQGRAYQGYPDYTPGAPYYYGGGYGVPGGWYGFPFWETLLVGSVLTGGLGGWGGYDSGYGTGYDAGYQAGENADDGGAGDGGGGWGDSSGSGSWGDGGWGDSGGGGDFGGGGSDGGGGGSW